MTSASGNVLYTVAGRLIYVILTKQDILILCYDSEIIQYYINLNLLICHALTLFVQFCLFMRSMSAYYNFQLAQFVCSYYAC